MTGAGLRFTTVDHAGRVVRTVAFTLMLAATAACAPMGGAKEAPQASAGADGQLQLNGVELSLWKSGQEAERTNQYEQAVGAYLNLYNRYPESVPIVSALVRNMRYAGRAREAVDVVLRGSPAMLDNSGLKFEYGKALLAAGDKVQALLTFEQVAEQRPRDWQVYSAMGIAYDAQGQYGAAIGSYQHALTLSPNNPVIFNNLAMSQAMSGNLQAAIATLETAAGINRSNPHIRQNLALLYAINGEEDKAKALASMDLSASEVENNLTFFRRFEGGGK